MRQRSRIARLFRAVSGVLRALDKLLEAIVVMKLRQFKARLKEGK